MSHIYVTESRLNQLQKLQTKAIAQIKPRQETLVSLKSLRILDVRELILLETLKLGYKVCNGLLPKPLENCIITDHNAKSNAKQHCYDTRLKHVPNLPVVSNTLYKTSALFDHVKQFQKLPVNLQQESKYSNFVKRVKQMLTNS